MRFFRRYFRVRIGHRKDDRIESHFPDHVRGKCSLGGEPEEDIGAFCGLFKRTERCIYGKPLLVLVHPLCAPLVYDSLGIAHHQVFGLDPERYRQIGTGNGGGAGAIHDNAYFSNFLVDELQSVDQRGG